MLKPSFQVNAFISSCASWKQFLAQTSSLASAERDAAFVRLTQIFLQTSSLYRNILAPEGVRRWDELSSDERAALGAGASGTDLVGKTRSGETWAFRTAFSQGMGAPSVEPLGFASHCVLVHTADEEVEGLDGRTGQIGPAQWNEANWGRILAVAAGKRFVAKAKKPRPHQVDATAAASTHFEENDRGRLVMPCGTGKSLTSILIAEALRADTIVVAAPSLALIRQNLAGWAEEFDAKGQTFDCLCVCSDQTVGDQRGDDSEVERASALGIEVTTDVFEIARRLGCDRNRPLVVFTTYHSSPILAEASRMIDFEFDLGMFDEAHKTVGATDRAFATLLDDELIKVRKRLSMTATERVYRGNEDNVLSMDSEEDYGACFYRLSFKSAIEKGLICDYKIVTFFVGEGEIRDLIESKSRIDVAVGGRTAFAQANALSLAAGIALKSVVREHGVKHIISFHRSIRDAENFSRQQEALDRIPGMGPALTCLHVSGAQPTARRAETMDRFASSEYGLVSNARCLTEGIDVPNTDCILFEGPKQSVIDIAQAAGRAMRVFPGKECGYIIVPVVVPEGMTFEEFAQTTEFRKVAQTLTAMSTQDERIASEFRTLSTRWSGGGGGGEDDEGIFLLRGSVPHDLGMEFSSFAAAVRTKAWDTIGHVNRRPFAEAREFVQALGLKNTREWKEYARSGNKPPDIPNAVDRMYADQGWVDWGDWLGTGKVADKHKQWRPFKEAREFVRSLGLQGDKEWRAFVKTDRKPDDIPSRPDVAYADSGWTTMGDFIGSKRKASTQEEDVETISFGGASLG